MAEINLCRTALALKAYRHRHGAYPAALSELKQDSRRDLPEDPFSDKDFQYRREGNGFKIYSIGPNLRDDGEVHDELTPSATG